MKYTETDLKSDNTDWTLMNDIIESLFGKSKPYHSLTKEEREMVDEDYRGAVRMYEEMANRVLNRWWE